MEHCRPSCARWAFFSGALFGLRWLARPPISIGKPVVAIGALVIIWGGMSSLGYAVWPRQRKTTVEEVPPQIVLWGNIPGGNTFAVVDGSKVSQRLRKSYKMVLIARVSGGTVDPHSDPNITVSNMFYIPEGQVRIEVEPTQPFLRRLYPAGLVELYLVGVPSSSQISGIRTLNDVLTVPGAVLFHQVAFSSTAVMTSVPPTDGQRRLREK